MTSTQLTIFILADQETSLKNILPDDTTGSYRLPVQDAPCCPVQVNAQGKEAGLNGP
jgi:hypothetical protein